MASQGGALVEIVVIFTLVLSAIFVSLRVVARAILKPFFGWDDIFITITWVVTLSCSTAFLVAIKHGYGEHSNDLTPHQIIRSQRAAIIGQALFTAANPIGKAAVAFLLIRLFPGRILKWSILFLLALACAVFYTDAALMFAQCHPISYQWNKSIEGGVCWDPKIIVSLSHAAGVIGATVDIAFVIAPWFYVRTLQMSLREKMSVGILLSLGILPFTCAILKVYYTATLNDRKDFTNATVPFVIWSLAELCAMPVAACIPTLRPVYLWARGQEQNGCGDVNNGLAYLANVNRCGEALKRFERPDARGTELFSISSGKARIYQVKAFHATVENRKQGELAEPGTETTVVAVHGTEHTE